jgi:hypothetical protein
MRKNKKVGIRRPYPNVRSNLSELEYQIFSKMAAEKKLELSLHLYYSARQLKEAALKVQYPDWTQKRIDKEIREIFLYARS